MSNKPSDPFGSIAISGDETAAEENDRRLPAAEELDAEEPIPSAPARPLRHSRLQEQRQTANRWRRRLTLLTAVPAAALFFYFLAGYLLVPYLLESVLPGRLSRSLDRPVSVGAASFNPFTLTVTLGNVLIGPRLTKPEEGIEPLLSFSRLELDLAAASFPKLGLICDEVTAHRLVLHLVRRQDGSYNLREMLPPGLDGLRFSLNNITLRDSRLLFNDRPAGATHLVEEIDLALPSLANIAYRPERFLAPRFAAKVNGSPLRLAGETRATAAGSEARLTLRLEDLDLSRYFAYLPFAADFTVSRGQADLDLNLLIRTGEETDNQLLIEGTGQLTEVWLQSAEGGQALARLPAARGIVSFAPLSGRYRLKELVLPHPEFLLERDPRGRWLLPRLTAAGGSRMEIDRLLVTGGKLSFVDRRVEGGFADSWTDLHLAVEGLAGDSGKQATFALSGRNQAQTRLSAQGRLHPEPLRAEGILVGNQVQLAAFNPYLEEARGLRFLEGGHIPKIEAAFTAGAGQEGGFELILRKLTGRINGMALARQGEEWLRLPEVVLKETAVEWPARQLVIGDLEAAGGFLLLDWNEEGRLNWDHAGKEGEGWQVAVKATALKEMAIDLRTRSLPEPLTLEFREAAVTVTDVATHQGSEGKLEVSASLFGESPVELAGSLAVAPFTARLAGRIEELSLLRLGPLASWLRPAIRRGTLQAEGELRLPEGVFQGSGRIDDFAAALEDKEILRCRRAAAPQLAADFRSGTVRAAAVTLTQPFAAWTFAGKSGSSLEGLFTTAWTTADGKPRLALDRVDIAEGELAFSDLAASPPYVATASGLAGSVAPLASTADSRSKFALDGQIDVAPLSLQGSWLPFADQPAAEIKAAVRAFPLATLSPYLREQLGYRLAGGTLEVAADLHPTGGQLLAANKLQVTGLALGEAVDRASRLPLAVALLADRNGRIDLDLLVEGDAGNPDFSYREELRRSLRNLLLRTAVSPFSFLVAIRPEAGLQEFLTFPPGRTELTPALEKQLQAMTMIMAERPQLKLVLKGFAGDQDRQAIKAGKETEDKARRQVREAQQAGNLTAAYGKEVIRLPAAPPVRDAAPRRLEVTDELLLQLASGRCENIHRYLVGLGLDPARVAIAPAGGPAADGPGRPGSRVEICLEGMRP